MNVRRFAGPALLVAGIAAVIGIAALPIAAIGSAQSDIADAADRLARIRAAAARPAPPAPFAAAGDDELRALASDRLASRPDLALRLDGLQVEPVIGTPQARHVVALLRGTPDAVVTLLAMAEAASPPLLAERVVVMVAREADAAEERPTTIAAQATFRAVVTPTGTAAPGARP